MLTDTAKNKIANKIKEIVYRGEYTKDGTVVSIPIHSIVVNRDTVTVLFNLDQNITGKITNFKLIDIDGEIFDERLMNVNKSTDGIFPSFQYSIKELII